MDVERIRPIAICVFRRGEDILVGEGYDRVKDETFYRPLGGAIEFGESSRDGIVREIREELGAEITGLEYLATIENVFTCDGTPGHEIVMVYQAAFADERFYRAESITGQEHDETGPLWEFTAIWKPLDYFRAGTAPLYPESLLELLDRRRDDGRSPEPPSRSAKE